MKAVRVMGHGGVDRLKYGDVPVPVPGRGDVLLRVAAVGLNHSDLWMRRGAYAPRGEQGGWQGEIDFPRIPGSDIVGTRVDNGERVVVYPFVSCGRCALCQEARDHLCPHTQYVGSERDGGYAEYVAVPERNLLPVPVGISNESAAAFPIAYLTTWHMAVTRGGLARGEIVLVSSAASGVGVATLQIARHVGAITIGLVGDESKVARTLAAGADHALSRLQPDWPARVREIADGRGVHMAVDVVGAATMSGSLETLREEGRMVTCGAASGPYVEFDVRQIYLRHLAIIGSTLGTLDELRDLLELLGEGVLDPIVDRVYPLAEAATAQAMLEGGSQYGKVVLQVSRDADSVEIPSH